MNIYLKERKPDILCILKTESHTELVGVRNGKYRMWRRDKNGKLGGDAIMVVVKDVMEKMELSEDMINMQILMNGGKKRYSAVAYVLPKMKAGIERNSTEMIDNTVNCLQRLFSVNDSYLSYLLLTNKTALFEKKKKKKSLVYDSSSEYIKKLGWMFTKIK